MSEVKRHTRWCFTSWDFNRMMRIKPHLFEKFVVGSEYSPTTNSIHYQSYCVSKKPYTLGEIKKIIDPKAHYEPAYGDEKACINYCIKDGLVISEHNIKNEEEEDIFDIFNDQN